MAKRRLGCISTAGIAAALVVALLSAGLVWAQGGTLFSPGPLNAQTGTQALGAVYAHAELAGRCEACHPAPWDGQTMAGLCLACHRTVAEDLRRGDGLHSKLTNSKATPECRACHPEHRGANAALTIIDSVTFPHAATGYVLTGHRQTQDGQPFACADCHGANLSRFEPTACTGCHSKIQAAFMSEHQADYGEDCLACHDGADRLGKGSARFDHASAAFKLQGQHADLACAECHNGARQWADFKSTPQDCVACHQRDDAHQGQLGTQCATCHNPNGWKPATFDHSKAAFTLIGKHAEVACKDCHADNAFKSAPQACAACHQKDDAHKGLLGTQCATCHNPNGWKPASFDHSQTAFALVGKHVGAACKDCHADITFKYASQECAACHQKDDIHKGQLGSQCATCHNPAGWKPATFDHSQAAFKLTGKHTEVACKDCHADNAFKSTPQQCAACHQKDDTHKGQLGDQCATCHSPNGWKPATFDHSQAAFKLIGKHTGVACKDCHADNTFKRTPQQCAVCHQKDDAHKGQLGTQCDACHSPAGWKPATFDHNKAAFPLTGKHAGVACKDCHADSTFKSTPQECAACHQKDDAHAGQFGAQCGACHNPSGWKPASFDHNKAAFPLTGKHTGAACKDCHASNVFKGTPQDCAACHLKNDAHGGQFGTQCGACHNPNGWKPATFDHNKAAFPLTGKHTGVTCGQCHVNNVFRGTAQTCEGCHREPAFHAGLFPTGCSQCHNVNGWTPAQFNQPHTFPFDHGRAAGCRDCHNDLRTYTCAKCHPDARILSEHQEHGVTNFQDCIRCHPTGHEGGGD